MIRRKLGWRMGGAALFAAACGSSFMHRQVLASAAGQPASAMEMGLGLASFILASLGMLLMVRGARLSGAWRKELDRRHEKRARNAERVSVYDRAAGTRRGDAPDAATKARRRP